MSTPASPSPETAAAPVLPAGRAIVLASGSLTRRRMFEAAGIPVAIDPPNVDEAELKRSMLAERVAPRDMADFLAELKAMKVSQRWRGALVIGADQILVQNGVVFDKPADMAHARAHLQAFRGRAHELISAVVICENGAPVWRHIASATLEMRPYTDDFIDAYLAAAGEVVLSSVGAYQVEGLGLQLFNRIAGDHFTIQGLPLLAVLDYLRIRGALGT
ncbi:Maf family protein [Zavarzinia compransoris]|uniref:Nucleoside triphosphate pyrophosphatase n=1 Tax=Zavarzinia compransoris TaxID=1264899 RepID=A0A317E5N9_9PROT|nr:Maf family protein [Zavarzinia compransoris]PWR20663.1 septum formation protein Maf [Zavarzinia compransoris]TDP44515.1 septum formation protein [Zavarzinia compransoris]